MAEGNGNSFELQQIIGLAAQQVQLLRGIKDSAQIGNATKTILSNTIGNPFAGSAAALGQNYNPFSTGASKATGSGFFGMPTFAQLGTGIAAQLVENRLGNTDISILSTGAPKMVSTFGPFNNKSKVNQEQRMMASANLSDKLTTGLLTGTSAALQAFVGLNPYTLAAGLVLNTASDQMKQQNAYNKYLLQNSYKFINYNESTNKNGMAGLGLSDRMQLATSLRHMNTEKKISDRDTQEIFSGLSEGGLLRDAQNVDEVTRKTSEYIDIIKKMASATGETYKSMVGLMADLKKMGIEPAKADEYASTMKALQNMTGIDYRTISNNISGAASAMSQNSAISAGNLVDTMSDKFLLSNALYDSVYKKAGEGDAASKRTLALINNLGGPEQAFAQVASVEQELLSSNQAGMEWLGLNFFDYDKNTGAWKFNKQAYQSIMSGGTDYNELISKATLKANTLDNVQKNSWLQNGAEYMMSNMDSAQSSQYIKSILNSLQKNAGYGERKMTTEEQLSLLMGMNSASAKLYGAQLDFANTDEGRQALSQGKVAAASENMINKLNANASGWSYNIKNAFAGAKDMVGDVVSPINTGLADLGERTGNWWNGYKFDKITIGASKTWEDIDTQSFSQAIKDASDKMLELANRSDELAKKYKDLSPVLTQLSSSIKKGSQQATTSQYGIGYMTGAKNTVGMVNTANLSMSVSGVSNVKDYVHKAKQGMSKTSFSAYLDIATDSSIETIGYEGTEKARELINNISNNSSAWSSKSKEEKMSDLGFLYSYKKLYGDYLGSADKSKIESIVSSSGDINTQYITGQKGQQVNIVDYAKGNTSSGSSMTGKEFNKAIKQQKKELDKATSERKSKIANNTWTKQDEEKYQQQTSLYTDSLNMQQMNKAMSQDTYAILGQVLTDDQMEEIGLKWDDITKGNYSTNDLENIRQAGTEKIAALTATQLGLGYLSSDLSEFFSDAGISVDDLRVHGNDSEYLQNAIEQGVNNLWSGISPDAGDPEKENTNATKDNTDAIKDNTRALLAVNGGSSWKGTRKQLESQYNSNGQSNIKN